MHAKEMALTCVRLSRSSLVIHLLSIFTQYHLIYIYLVGPSKCHFRKFNALAMAFNVMQLYDFIPLLL